MKIQFFSLLVFMAMISSCGESSTDEENTEPIKEDSVTVNEKSVDSEKKEGLTDAILLPRMGENNLYGYQDTSGNWLIKPQFIIVGEFSDGLAPVISKDSLRYVIDEKGKRIFKSPYDFIVLHHELSGEVTLNGFHNGMIPVIDGNQKIGFIDDEFKLRIPYKYDEIGFFSEGVCPVYVKREKFENNWGLIDKDGKWIVRPSLRNILSASCNRIIFYDDKLGGVMDLNGKTIVTGDYNHLFRFKEGLTFAAPFGDYNNYFIMDTMGTVINDGPYDQVFNLGFENGECEVMKNGKCIIIDKKGNKIRDKKDGCQEGC